MPKRFEIIRSIKALYKSSFLSFPYHLYYSDTFAVYYATLKLAFCNCRSTTESLWTSYNQIYKTASTVSGCNTKGSWFMHVIY